MIYNLIDEIDFGSICLDAFSMFGCVFAAKKMLLRVTSK